MIYDCITFFNEVDLVELRFEILDQFVTAFVVAEADTTHSGIDKPYYFEQNYDRFRKWAHKIIYLKVTGLPKSENRWLAENAQRNALIKGIPSNGFVMVSDADEIPNLNSWNGTEGVFQQLHSFYKINKIIPRRWNGTVITQAWRFNSPFGKITPQDCRNFRDILRPVGAGWHFSWLEDAETKIKAFAHAELEANGWKPDDTKHPTEDILLETISLDDYSTYYPWQIVSNRSRFHKWIAPTEEV